MVAADWRILDIRGALTVSFSIFFFFSSRRRHTRCSRDWSSDVCSSDLCHEKNVRLKSSLFVYDEYWTRVLGYIPRLLESVILKPGEKEHLIQDIEKFKRSEERRVGKECRSRWSTDQYKKERE